MTEHYGSTDNYLDFSNTEYGDKEFRNELKHIRFEYVDFTNSNFQNCNLTNVLFINCNFTRCNFSEVRQWNCIYENCKFEKTKFYNATMGVEVKYSDCQFKDSKLKGRQFSFGHNSHFINCNFEICEITSTWILTTKFVECAFSSKFSNIRFSGELEAKVAASNDRLEFPATFIKCDFSRSIFEEIEIMDGVILIETILPDQHHERFNNDRIFYP